MTRQTKAKAAKALKHLMEARAGLAAVSTQLDRDAETTAPGSIEEKAALQLTRCMNHISEAIADIPTALWCAMIKDADIPLENLSKNLNAA